MKTYNFIENIFENKLVLEVNETLKKKVVKITYENGFHNISTLDHPYFVENKGWTSFTGNEFNDAVLEVGDLCYFITVDGQSIIKQKITSSNSKT